MDWFTTLPPLLAVVVAIWKREVILALTVALFSAEFLLASFNPLSAFTGSIARITGIFSSSGNTEILLFSLLIGALLALVRNSGGVIAFVEILLTRNIARSARSTGILTTLLGIVIFIESYLSVLASGIFAQSLFDRFKMSRARLAYIIDSTCSPVSVLILLNGWGAYILGLLDGYGLENPMAVMLGSIPLNMYAIFTLLIVFYTCWTNKVMFTLASHEKAIETHTDYLPKHQPGKARYFIVPILTLIISFIGFMLYTGKGNMIAGSGSSSVLYAVVLAIITALLLLSIDKKYSLPELTEICFKGMGELLPAVSIILLAFSLGSSMQALGTGPFIAGLISDTLPLWGIAPVVFITAGIISFTTGTSWGTFGILLPVAIPVAIASDLSPSLLLAAVLGGGVFGDHCSPISDSTVLASLASGCNHLDHVRTQLPYALLAAGLSLPFLIIFSL
ncbi:MAG: tetracycline resistance efflux pump [Pseudohongiellaceae bacterium]|jgi:tetracycline resistance efflux pump